MKSKAPRIVCCIAAHQRARPLQTVLRLLPKDWHVVLVLSEGEDAWPYAHRKRTHVHHAPNRPLGRKWQRAVLEGMLLRPDYLVILGSDDVLRTTTKRVLELMHGHDALGVRGLMAYDGTDHYWCVYKPAVTLPIGTARVYRASLLNRMRWSLFDKSLNAGLDNHGWERSKNAKARWCIADRFDGFEVISLKGPWAALNPLKKYLTAPTMKTTKVHVRDRVDYQF